MHSLKAAFLAAFSEFKYKSVTIPGGLKLTVRSLTGEERMEYEQKLAEVVDGELEYQFHKQKPCLIAMTLCESNDGVPDLMFNSVEDFLNAVNDTSAFNELFIAASEINGMAGDKDEKKVS